MGKRTSSRKAAKRAAPAGRPSALVDTRIIYCGDCLDQLSSEPRPSGSGLLPKLPAACVDLIYIDPPFNSNRNYEVFWGNRTEPRPSGSGSLRPSNGRHASTAAYIDYMRPRCVELARVLKRTGSFYYHCDWQHRTNSARIRHRWS